MKILEEKDGISLEKGQVEEGREGSHSGLARV